MCQAGLVAAGASRRACGFRSNGMKRVIRSFGATVAAAVLLTQYSCATMVGSAIRDAAIDGAAIFVEGATTEFLDAWFGAVAEE